MASDWTEVSLSELTTKITKGTTPTKKDGGFSSEGVNYIKSEAVTFDGRIDESKFTFISSEIHKKLKRSQLEESDILMSMAGIHLGKTAIVRTRHLPANTNQALALIRPIRNKIYPDYLFYFLQQPSVVYFINNSTSQSAQPNINLQEIGSLNIQYPEYNEQKAIAHILGSLDDKIELNRQMNETLEAMAQALFKSWFVDFDPVIDNALAAGNAIPDELLDRAEQRKGIEKKDNSDIQGLFPDEFEFTEEMGWIPKGWEIGSFAELAELDTTSVKPNFEPEKIWEHFSIPSFDINATPAFETGESIKSNKYKVNANAILVSKLNPETERIWWVNIHDDDSAVCSTEFMQFIPKNFNHRTFIYSLLRSEYFRAEILSRVTGSTGSHQRTQPKSVAVIDVLKPNEELVSKFSQIALDWKIRVSENIEQDAILAKIRDTLLPKLMSGELRISDAAVLVDEAV